jgi:long-chain fatty acid transport protein
MMFSTRMNTLAISIGCAMLAGSAHAGGLFLTTFATPAMGTASAGANAVADDASTAFNNPAGMTRLDDHSLLTGLAPGFTDIKFDPDKDTPTDGGDGGHQGSFVPMMNASYVHKISDRWRLGMNMFSLSGAGLDPNDGWTGRHSMTEIELLTLSFLPTVAVRVTDWLSVGGGPLITYGRLDVKLRVPLSLFGEPTVKLDDLTDWDVTPAVGILLEPTDRLRFGVMYFGKIDFHLDGDVKIPAGAGTPGINLDLPLAQAVRTSVYWEVNDTIDLMMSGGWEDWSVAKNLPISAGAVSADLPLNYRDTWYLGAGIHYKVGDRWTLQTGFRYDSSALKDGDRTVALPSDQVLTAGVGVKYDWSEKLRIGFHFGYTDLGKAKVNQPGIVKGKYRHNDLYLFGVTLNWKELPWSGRGTF